MNRQTLKDVLKSKLEHRHGIRFNEIIDDIFSTLYGENYNCIKQNRDLGSDGIIETEKVCLACYAPEVYNNRRLENKVDEDFAKYERNYKELGYRWRFIINKKLLGSMVTYIKNKDIKNEVWGIEELINFILKLRPSKRRKVLSDILQLPNELITFDFMEEVIDEILILREESTEYKPRYTLRQNTFEKIELNFTGEDIEIMKRKFLHFYPELISYLSEVLNSLDDSFISNLKMTILHKYELLSENLSFKEKFRTLSKIFSSKYPNDEEYRNYVELILLYFFEQCLIGINAEENR